MEYTKPEITLTTTAAAAIQGMTKPSGNHDNIPLSDQPSVAAYESDE